MDEKAFKDELRCIRSYLRNDDIVAYAGFADPLIADKMEELADLIDDYARKNYYSKHDFTEDIITIMEFLASDEVAKFSDGKDLQLSMLQAALVNYVDSLDCFDVAQED